MYFLLLFQQLLASLTHILSKNITNTIPAPVILFYRATLSALLFIGWIFISRKKIRRFEWRDLPTLLILGLINIPINQYLFLYSIHLTSAPNVALAYAMSPAFVLIIAFLFMKERTSLQKVIGIIIALAGTSIILFEKGVSFHSDYFTGNMLALLASISWAFYTILGKDFSIKYGAIYSTGLAMIVGFVLYIPIYLFVDASYSIYQFTTTNWLQIAYLGIFSSAVSYVLWYYALKKIDASKVSVFNNFQVVLTTVLSVFFLNAHITLIFIIGGILIVGGVITTQRG